MIHLLLKTYEQYNHRLIGVSSKGDREVNLMRMISTFGLILLNHRKISFHEVTTLRYARDIIE